MKLHRAFGDGQDIRGALQYDLRVGAVAGAHERGVGQRDSRLDLKLYGAVLLFALGGDVFEDGVEGACAQRADGQLDGHALADLADLRLVHIAAEDHVVHVGHGGDGGAVVEAVALDHGVTHLDRHVEDHAGDGTADLRGTRAACVARDAIADNLECALGVGQLLFGLAIIGFRDVELLGGEDALLKELFVAAVRALHLV